MSLDRSHPFMTVQEIKMLKSSSKMPHHWSMRREFLLAHRGKFDIDRLLSLSYAFINIKCLGLTYPDEVMETIEQLNCVSGMKADASWVDELQDIARSSYADMLNDDERNKAYDEAIRKCVFTLVKSKTFNLSGDHHFECCDIGTGSGLLSMMTVRAFQSLNYDKFHVTAFEAFGPMASCARQVIGANGLSEFITVIAKRSDQSDDENERDHGSYDDSVDVDDKSRFNLLVAELLDTELIGEGCLEAYRHAVDNLCSPCCLFVPHQARIYIEPVASSLLFQRHVIDDLKLEVDQGRQVFVRIPENIRECCGNPTIDDVQVSMLRKGQDFIRISEPQEVFRFTFNDLNTLKLSDNVEIEFPVRRKIDQPPVIVMWWDIVMYDKTVIKPDTEDEPDVDLEVLSCAPTWARDEDMLRRDDAISALYGRDVWREHWIQGIYYLSDVVGARKLAQGPQESTLKIYAYHDTHSLWFNLSPCKTKLPDSCTCGVHRALSRSQVAFLNDKHQMSKLANAAWVNEESQNFPIECEIKFHTRPVNGVGGSCGEVCTDLKDDLKWRLMVLDNNRYLLKRTSSLSDPSISGEIPWESLMARLVNKQNMEPVESFDIKCTQVYFNNLNRIRTDRRECEGFNLSALDRLINESSKLVDNVTESHYLWEYGGKRIDLREYLVFSSKIGGDQTIERIKSGTFRKQLRLKRRGPSEWRRGWALVFWVELKLVNTCNVLSTGPMQPESNWHSEQIEWNRHCKQVVYFMHNLELPKHRADFSVDAALSNANLQVKVEPSSDHGPSRRIQ